MGSRSGAADREEPARSSTWAVPTPRTSIFPNSIIQAFSGLRRRFSSDELSDSPPGSSMPWSVPDQTKPDELFQPWRMHKPGYVPPLRPLELVGGEDLAALGHRVISPRIAATIRAELPSRTRLARKWTMVYGSLRDGASLHTMYNNCAGARKKGTDDGYVFAVRDWSSNVFGAYLTEPPQMVVRPCGSSACFLWKIPFKPRPKTVLADRTNRLGDDSEADAADDSVADQFEKFSYTGENESVLYCTDDYVSVGVGEGQFGLWIGARFDRGQSGPCPTFRNAPLSDEGVRFDIRSVEVWSVGG